jgi:hypothetical protein
MPKLVFQPQPPSSLRYHIPLLIEEVDQHHQTKGKCFLCLLHLPVLLSLAFTKLLLFSLLWLLLQVLNTADQTVSLRLSEFKSRLEAYNVDVSLSVTEVPGMYHSP